MQKLSTWSALALLGLTGSCAPEPAATQLSTRHSASTLAPALAYRVKDINPGAGDGLPEPLDALFHLHALGSTLFLNADDGVSGPALWRSDGTEAGTKLVKDFTPDTSDGLGHEPAVLGDAMYFFAASGSDRALWKMTERAETPSLVHPLSPRGDFPPHSLRAIGTSLSFIHSTADMGSEPWMSDGTEQGTHLRADVHPGPGSSESRLFRMVGDTLTFAANDGVHGNELWRSDPSKGVALVRDLDADGDGLLAGGPGNVVLGSTLYFAGSEGVNGSGLWRSDGTDAGTWRVKAFPEGTRFSYIDEMAVAGATLFFTLQGSDAGVTQLWRSDGTEQGTALLREFLSRGSVGALVALEDRLLFVGPGSSTYFALWSSDGTEAGTVRLKDVEIAVDHRYGYRVLGGLLMFTGDDGVHGQELWRSDGTPEGTFMLMDLRPGPEGSDASQFALAGDTLYFRATDGVSGYEPWAVPMAKVHDPFAPTLTCPADVAVTASQPSSDRVSYAPAQASDNSAEPVSLSYSHPSGGLFSVGDTEVVVTATDAAKNEVHCSFHVVVRAADPVPPKEPGCASTSSTSAGWLALLSLLATGARRRRLAASFGARLE